MAIETTMQYLFSSTKLKLENLSMRSSFQWKMVVKVIPGPDTLDLSEIKVPPFEDPRFEEIAVTLNRSQLTDGRWGPWRVDPSEIEAVLGLWGLQLKTAPSLKPATSSGDNSCGQSDNSLRGGPILRVLGPYNISDRMNYERWIVRGKPIVRRLSTSKNTPLDLAIRQRAGAVVGLLLFYGTKDLNGGASKFSQASSLNGSEAAVATIRGLGLPGAGYRRALVYWAVWEGAEEALRQLIGGKLPGDKADLEVKDDATAYCGDE